MSSLIRTRWAAIGAAVAVTLGAGGIGLVAATSPSDATAFVPITPCRVMDTRPAPDTVGPRSAPLAANDTHTVTVHGDNGNCTGIPSSATGVQLNVTAVGASTLTFLTIWETGQSQPDASSLNPSPGQPPTPNAVTTSVNASGQFNVFNKFGTVNVLADVTGYYVDHHHDDRYYTKAQADDLFGPPPEPTFSESSIFEMTPSSDLWLLQGGWAYTGTDLECLYAPVPTSEGASVSNVVINYLAGAQLVADDIGVVSLRTTAGPAGIAQIAYHHYNADVTFPATAGNIASLTITNDETETPASLSTTPLPGDDYDTTVAICVRNPIRIVSMRVNYG